MQPTETAREEPPSQMYSSAAASSATLDGNLSVLAYSQRSLSGLLGEHVPDLSIMSSGTLDPSWVEDELDVNLLCLFEVDRVAGNGCDEGNRGTHSLPQRSNPACGAG